MIILTSTVVWPRRQSVACAPSSFGQERAEAYAVIAIVLLLLNFAYAQTFNNNNTFFNNNNSIRNFILQIIY
jgi:hypothetical protein